VVAAFVVAGFYANPDIAIKIKSVFVKVPPKASQTQPSSQRLARAFVAQAPWVLGVLPECFRQTQRVSGPLAYVLAQLPKGATMVRPGSALDVEDCRVAIQGESVLVSRGGDRMRVPAPARLYSTPGWIALLRAAYNGYELRIYKTQ
jgi:hypothetical protein